MLFTQKASLNQRYNVHAQHIVLFVGGFRRDVVLNAVLAERMKTRQ